jgi:NAD(P)-dependent dehydrogenase (short-subunit alcohol dehydrogenase family)
MKRQVALLTGTSSGFGLLTAVGLAQDGFYVLATMRDPDKAGALRAAMTEAGVSAERYEVLRLDVTDEVQVNEVVAAAIERHGQLDVLVNNAGYAQGGFVEEMSLDTLRAQFETNFFGLVAVTKSVLPQMRRQRKGKIVNLSSISGLIGIPAMSAYCASKFAVEGWSESLRHEMRQWGVDVVLVEPAAFRTNVWETGLARMAVGEDSPYGEQLQAVHGQVLRSAEQGGDPAEVVDLIRNLVRRERSKFRHPVGKGAAQILRFKNLLPFRLIERMVQKELR